MNWSWFVFGLFAFHSVSCSSAIWRRAGDYMLGGLFPVTRGPNCSILNEESLALVDAFIFAVNSVNGDAALLSNSTLGYRILDTCSNASVERKNLLSLLKSTHFEAGSKNGVLGIVSASLATADVLSKHQVAQVSYMATNTSHRAYGTLFHTAPSPRKRLSALVDVIGQFRWSCMNVIHSSNPAFQDITADLVAQLAARNVCVALAPGDPHQALSSLPRASVAVVLGELPFLAAVFLEARKQNLTEHVWIVPEAPGLTRLAGHYGDVTCGMLSVRMASANLKSVKAYMKHDGNLSTWFTAKRAKKKFPRFRGNGNFAAANQQWSNDVTAVVDAVLALARGLHEVTSRRSSELSPQRLAHALREISFRSARNTTAWFDRRGDLSGDYLVVNAKLCSRTAQPFVAVGEWVERRSGEGELTLHTEAIRWPGSERKVPIPECMRPCPVGAPGDLDPVVCSLVCPACPPGAYRKPDAAIDCTRCPAEPTADTNSSGCVVKPLNIMRATDGLCVLLLTACSAGELLTILVLCVFVRFRSSHVVKASNLSFCAFTLLALLVWFAAPLLSLGAPTDLTCQLQLVSSSLLFTSISAALCTKTTRVVRIFRAIKGTRFLSSTWYSFLTCALILVQVTLCAVHWLIFPPRAVIAESVHSIVPFCHQNSVLYFASLGYDIFLSLLCAWSAFSSRRLPGRYNEAKWICLAMLTCLLSWSTLLIGQLLMVNGRIKTAVQSLSFTAGAYAILLFLFFPKLHVIFFKPEKNTVQAAVASARRFSFEVANKKSLYDGVARRHTSPECLKLDSAVSATSGVYKVSSVHIPLNALKPYK